MITFQLSGVCRRLDVTEPSHIWNSCNEFKSVQRPYFRGLSSIDSRFKGIPVCLDPDVSCWHEMCIASNAVRFARQGKFESERA
jgi:hypothetical protein